MRELKFRAWVEWTEKPRFEYSENNYPDTFWNDYDDGDNVEQYTGLKGKNGKEIYEGDIVKMPEWQVEPRYEVVKYNKAGFDPFQEGCFECMSPDGDDVEVIGNIHENPELLKGDE